MSEEEEKSVPYSRFEKKNTELAATKIALSEMQTQLDESRKTAEGAQTLAAQLEQLKADTNAERETHKTTLALSVAGVVDEETAELVRWRFAKSGRSADEFPEWLKNEAPGDKLLASVFSKPAPLEEAAAPTTTPRPPVNDGTRSAPPPRADHSLESVQRMSIDEARENYSTIMKNWGLPGHDFSKR